MRVPPAEEAVESALERDELRPLGYLTNASNHTVLCQLGESRGDATLHAVYKPREGERPLWDFESGSLCRREVAARVVSRFLGWDLVPPTVLRDGPFGEGSAQLFVEHDPRRHYFVLVEDDAHDEPLARMALFDLLVNNTDRKGSHVLYGEADGRIHGIDHGLTFHVQPKLRTVIWAFAGWPIPAADHADLRRLVEAVGSGAEDPCAELSELLQPGEVRALVRRAEVLAVTPSLPDVDEDDRPYPWPPL